MTTTAMEGFVTEPVPAEFRDELPIQIPVGQEAFFAAPFRPNPSNDPEALAHFNIFLRCVGFNGTAMLLKQPPADSELFPHWFSVTLRGEAVFSWALKPGGLLCEAIAEPENGVAYGLLCVGTLGDGIQYRFSY